MTHAWLFTGPPGSGRSVAARAFAAALLCPDEGCGQCPSCHQVAAGTHADLLLIRPDGLSYGVRQTRELVLKAAAVAGVRRLAGRPVRGRRPGHGAGGERAAQGHRGAAAADDLAALRAVGGRPAADDQVPVPAGHAAHAADRRGRAILEREGVSLMLRWRPPGPRSATSAGPAGSRPTRETAQRRADVLAVPLRVTGLAEAFAAAAALVKAAEAEAAATTEELDVPEREALKRAFGEGSTGKGVATAVRGAAGALKELEDRQKSRATRIKRDALDLALLDLAAFYRDVLAVQLGAQVELANASRER